MEKEVFLSPIPFRGLKTAKFFLSNNDLDFHFVGILLKNGRVLQKMIIHNPTQYRYSFLDQRQLFKAAQKLFGFQRSCPERQAVKQPVGVQFYGCRSDLTAREMRNRFTGYKRSNSDSGFMGSSRDGFPRARSDSIEGLHLVKVVNMFSNPDDEYFTGGEQLRHSSDNAMFLCANQMRTSPSSLTFQPPASNNINVSVTKSEKALKRFRDANAAPYLISQASADEGSQTGIKGSGILPTINARSGISEGNPPSGILLSGSKLKFGTQTCPESATNPPSRHGLKSRSRQMTIFYSGQAHVFDDVPPKQDDLVVNPLSSSSVATLLEGFKVPISGVEEHEV